MFGRTMEFKIDTKTNYTVINPVSNMLDANLAAAISEKCRELSGIGSRNYIIDLSECRKADASAFGELISLHEYCYEQECSLVFTGLDRGIMEEHKGSEWVYQLNIAPTMAEAVDIISMEILERDLFSEEE